MAEAGAPDAPVDRRCDPTARFGTPVALPTFDPANVHVAGARFTADERTMVFYAFRGQSWDLFSAGRASSTAPFAADASTSLGDVNTLGHETSPWISGDGKTLYFSRAAALDGGGYAGWDLMEATRPSTDVPFHAARTLPHASPQLDEYDPFGTVDGEELWWAAASAGGRARIRYARVRGGTATNAAELAFGALPGEDVRMPVLSADELSLYFARGTPAAIDLFVTRRATVDEPFADPVRLDTSTLALEYPSFVSQDDCRLYTFRYLPAGWRIFVAEREGPEATTAPSSIQSASRSASAPVNHDSTRATDGPITADGAPDNVVEIDVTGPLDGLGLISTDPSGRPLGGQCDTWVTTDTIPPGTAFSDRTGASTWQLGVFEGNALMNDAAGRFSVPPGRHRYSVTCTWNGPIPAGQTMRLIGKAPNGALVTGELFNF